MTMKVPLKAMADARESAVGSGWRILFAFQYEAAPESSRAFSLGASGHSRAQAANTGGGQGRKSSPLRTEVELHAEGKLDVANTASLETTAQVPRAGVPSVKAQLRRWKVMSTTI